jgi:8-oxo-dGTP diphosphatase
MDNIPCTYRVSVKAAIKDNEGKFLLLREKNGDWELPGGGLEHGENPKYGLAREISEETGLVVQSVSDRPIAFWTIRKEVGSPTRTWFAFVLYEVQVTGQFSPQSDSDEAEGAGYFSKDEVASLRLHDNTRPYFLQA